jgi:hypothetical protein
MRLKRICIGSQSPQRTVVVEKKKNLKYKVYGTNPHRVEELKENVRRETLVVPREEFLRVNFSLFKLYGVCVHVQGHHFQNLYGKLIL